ncbi:MAG: hypothetical protein ACJ76Z_06450 [Thermoleophilaceae bacterium]
MSDSYPTIHDSLSDMQREFMGCVEMHLDPPETAANSYRVEAVYRYDDGEAPLPGDAVRFTIAVAEAADDVEERRHTIEFLSLANGKPEREVGHIRHSMKRTEARQGSYYWTESQFQVESPDVPRALAPQAEVEHEVEEFLDRLKVLDDGHRLTPV